MYILLPSYKLIVSQASPFAAPFCTMDNSTGTTIMIYIPSVTNAGSSCQLYFTDSLGVSTELSSIYAISETHVSYV
jgi:hypothetical protein